MKKEELRIVFMGTPEFAVGTLQRLVEGGYNVVAVVTQPDKPVGRHQDTLQPSEVKRYALAHSLPVLQPVKMKDPDSEHSDYVALSAGYTDQKFSITVTGYLNFIDDMIVKDNVKVTDDAKQQLLDEFGAQGLDESALAKIKTYGKYVNSDKGIVKGVNVSTSYNITDDLNFTANYSYTYARTREVGVWTNLARSVRNSGTVALNYGHTWGKYTLNANLNGRFQSKTYFPDYEDGPGYGIVNLNTTHTFRLKQFLIEPSLGIDNIFNKVDDRIRTASTYRYYPLLSPGTMVVVGLKLRFS